MRSVYRSFRLSAFIFLFVTAHGLNLCTPGSYLTPTSKQCAPCPPGTFQPNSNATDCIPCPKESISSKKGATFCTPCGDFETPGHDRTYCDCAIGYVKYRTDKCETCPPGSIPYRYNGCFPCPPGTYQPNGEGLSCPTCPDGSFSGGMAVKCIACPEGDVLIKDKCGKCPAGKFYKSYSPECGKCDPGTYTPVNNTASYCLPCPPGSYSGYGSAGCVSCENGEALLQNGKCGSCSAGQYYVSEKLKCFKCPADTFTPERNAYPSCFNCGYSSFSFPGSKKCTRCKYGSSLLSSGTCGKCPPGTYLDADGGHKCVKCGPNKYSFGGIAEDCASCPLNTYALPGSSSCITCPGGQALIVPKGKCGVCSSGREYNIDDGTCDKSSSYW